MFLEPSTVRQFQAPTTGDLTGIATITEVEVDAGSSLTRHRVRRPLRRHALKPVVRVGELFADAGAVGQMAITSERHSYSHSGGLASACIGRRTSSTFPVHGPASRQPGVVIHARRRKRQVPLCEWPRLGHGG